MVIIFNPLSVISILSRYETVQYVGFAGIRDIRFLISLFVTMFVID